MNQELTRTASYIGDKIREIDEKNYKKSFKIIKQTHEKKGGFGIVESIEIDQHAVDKNINIISLMTDKSKTIDMF